MQRQLFEFEDFREYIRVAGPSLFPKNPKAFSLSLLSKKLGYKSHRTIAMILDGNRLPSVDMIERFAKLFKFNAKEKAYFSLLVLKERWKGQSARLKEIQSQIREFKSNRPARLMSSKELDAIFNSYFLVIKQLALLPDFKADPDWIRNKLAKKASNIEINNALMMLKHLGILSVDSDSGELSLQSEDLHSTYDMPSKSIRAYHKQMIDGARDAIVEQDIKDRHFMSVTMAFDRNDMEKAKQSMDQFVEEFNQRFSSKRPNSVYQINLNLYSHTKLD